MNSKALLIWAIWNGEIDQMSTREIAEKFRMSQPIALRFLKKVASGQSGDARFVYNQEREGVQIADGSIWTYSPMNIDGDSAGGNGVKHYIWFCS